jgi:hypothetical protein
MLKILTIMSKRSRSISLINSTELIYKEIKNIFIN